MSEPRSNNVSAAGEVAGINPDSSQCCGLCSHNINGEYVVCSKCGGKFHTRLSCLGVSEAVLSVLSSCRDGSVCYTCCVCRVAGVSNSVGSSDVLTAALNQMLGAFKGMVSQLSEVMNEIKLMRIQQNNPVGSSTNNPGISLPVSSGASVRSQVLESVKELNEWEKRKKWY